MGYNQFRNLKPESTFFEGQTPQNVASKNENDPRTYFVLHQTVAGNLTKEKVQKRYSKRRSRAHVYVFKDGSTFFLWPFSEVNVWATKVEEKTPPGKGKMIHIEIDYEDGGKPTEAQYNTVATLYETASDLVAKYLTIVPHIEVDRGLAGGHEDPQNFDYNHFYEILRSNGIPIDAIDKFDHDRYWGKDSYKIPYATDKFSWPPKLSGNPHK